MKLLAGTLIIVSGSTSRNTILDGRNGETTQAAQGPLIDLLPAILKIIVEHRHLSSGHLGCYLNGKAGLAGLGSPTDDINPMNSLQGLIKLRKSRAESPIGRARFQGQLRQKTIIFPPGTGKRREGAGCLNHGEDNRLKIISFLRGGTARGYNFWQGG